MNPDHTGRQGDALNSLGIKFKGLLVDGVIMFVMHHKYFLKIYTKLMNKDYVS